MRLHGHERGVADLVAQGILDFHRHHRGTGFFAEQLLVHAEHASSLEDLDRGYKVLEHGDLIERTGETVTVKDTTGKKHTGPAYNCR